MLLIPHGVNHRRAGRQVAAGLVSADKKGKDLVLRGAHPDLIELSPLQGKESIGIDQVRAVIRQGQFSPTQGTRRVCMITDAAALTPEAANSLLKVLEEPPRGLTFLLLVEHVGNILPTILSRSRVIRLPSLSKEDRLIQLVNTGYPPEEAEYLLTIARGNQEEIDRFYSGSMDITSKRNRERERAHTAEVDSLLDMVTDDDPVSRYEGTQALLERLVNGERSIIVSSAKVLARAGRAQVDRFLEDLLYMAFDLIRAHPAIRTMGDRAVFPLSQGLKVEKLLKFSASIERARQSLKGYVPLEPLLLWILLMAWRLS